MKFLGVQQIYIYIYVRHHTNFRPRLHIDFLQDSKDN